jgi:hypothetical protein
VIPATQESEAEGWLASRNLSPVKEHSKINKNNKKKRREGGEGKRRKKKANTRYH